MRRKCVLVTGAGTGIGRGIALELASRGYRVAIHYSRSSDGARSAAAEITAKGGHAEIFRADFRDIDEVRRLATAATDYLGGLDVLVNNAGITANLPFERISPEQFATLYDVNIRAMFFLTQALLPALENARGTVVNITSIHAYEGMREHTAYAGTKGAIVAFTRALAVELAPRGIRVNGVAPGCVHVENYATAIPGFSPEAAGDLIPVGFCGTPADIAQVVAFLASEHARYILGQVLIVDGGTTAWMPFHKGFTGPTTNRFGSGYIPGL
jgi:glucose 1-dehydrogenase